jgi:hypothetical protein
MTVILRIKRKEFEAIKNGTKKTEWRRPSLYNKRILLSKNSEGKFCENKELKEVTFINGYSADSQKITIEVELIRPVKFSSNIEIKEDLFIAMAGECSIQIKLGKIIK